MISPKYEKQRRKPKPPRGFTSDQKVVILHRDGGLCALCGKPGATEVNHRSNRGSGGSRTKNTTSNGCAIHGTCNSLIEADAGYAEDAIALGVKLHSWADPTLERFWMWAVCEWVLLDNDGCWKEVESGEVADG